MIADPNHFIPGLGTGLAGGVLSGLFGVGGGVVMVPLLGPFLHLDQHRAQGATLAAMLLPTGLPAVVVIPLLATHFRMTQHEAQLTSLMMLSPPSACPASMSMPRPRAG